MPSHGIVAASLCSGKPGRRRISTGLTFESICRRKTALLTIAQAALEDAWEYMAPRECALFILDETACILSRNGDPQTLQQLSALGFHDARIAPRELLVLVRYR